MLRSRRSVAKGNPRRRLRVEPLERRLVPATFVVTTGLDVNDPNDHRVSLREAIALANAHPGPDTVVVPAGVYNLTHTGAGDDGDLTGDLDITDTVVIRGAGAAATVIDGQRADRVFDVRGMAAGPLVATLRGLTVRNGLSNDVPGGGGILVTGADLTLRGCAVIGNQTVFANGGGISGIDGDHPAIVTLVRSTVSRNQAGSDGGGVWLGQFLFRGGDGRLTADGCTISRNVTGGSGGGLSAPAATLTRCTVTGNRADSDGGGGDIFSAATLTGCTVAGNVAGREGGGLIAATLELGGCTVAGNVAADGGGLASGSSATLTRTVVRGNFAAHDGGGAFGERTGGPVSLVGCTVDGNVAGSDGGGLIAVFVALVDSTVADNVAAAGDGGGVYAGLQATLSRCTVSGNSAREGGGVFANNGLFPVSADLTNCTVSGNSARQAGGGISGSVLTLVNVTVTDNTAASGGGVAQSGPGPASVKNTIVAQNRVLPPLGGPDVSGLFLSQGHNLIGVGDGAIGSGSFVNGVNGDHAGSLTDPLDPRLGALASHGGPTQTHALLAGSPAVDAGDTGGAPSTDQRGVRRPRGGGIDIGAFER
jgi:predicted outer membrane repeat protein